jgi:signal transduction histidine kinase
MVMSDLHASEAPIRDSGASAMASLRQQLAQAQAELAALRQEQATLAHGLSHDLRAPLRAIDQFSALVQADPTLAPAMHAHLARVRAAAQRMDGLIEALLTLSLVNRAELHPEVVDLALLVECALAQHQDAEPGRPLQASIAPGLRVRGDERLLRVLVAQLVDNAWKFSRGREQVCIRVAATPVGDRLRIDIHDRGCGFGMRYADKLFQPFQRLVGGESGGGHGLGLAIARRIVERHGGRMDAGSSPDAGSRFGFDLAAAGPA